MEEEHRMRNIQGEEPRRRILVTFAQQPAPTLDELSAAIGKSKSNLNHHMKRLVQQGQIVVIGGPRAAVCSGSDASRQRRAARLLVERAERRGGYAVVPWAAVEAVRELLK